MSASDSKKSASLIKSEFEKNPTDQPEDCPRHILLQLLTQNQRMTLLQGEMGLVGSG